MESGRKWVCARKGPSLPAALVLGAPWQYPDTPCRWLALARRGATASWARRRCF